MTPFGEHRDPREAAALAATERGAAEAADGAAAAGSSPPGIWWEILAVMCIAAAPWIVDGLTLDRSADRSPKWQGLALDLVHSLHCILILIPVLWIARRGGMSWKELGFVRPNGLGIVACFITTVLTAGVHQLTWLLWCAFHPRGASKLVAADEAAVVEEGAGDAVVAEPTLLEDGALVVAQVLNGIAEESAMRAYLLMRLRLATGSWGIAILGSTAVFAAYHSHYDAFGMTDVFVAGLVFAAAWLVTRNLWVVALAHAAGNLWIYWA